MPGVDDILVKPFGAKARRFARRAPADDKSINILYGSVRSAKTWTMIPKLLQLCDYPVAGQKVFVGVTKQSVYNNVLSDLFAVVGASNYSYNRNSGELEILGSKWLVFGAKDAGSEKYLRGITLGVAYCDELVLLDKEFVRMLLNRLSVAGARLYGTTNPENPMHWVKTDLLDNQELIRRGDIFAEHFTLDDNPNLPEGFREHLAALYKGVYYERFVLGNWVMAEGAIYGHAWSDEWLHNDADTVHLGRQRPFEGVEQYIAVDYGTVHPQVYLWILDDGDHLWVEDEYFWDSGNAEYAPDGALMGGYQKTDMQYADDLEAMVRQYPSAQVILPPEAASFEAEIRNRGLWYTIANNAVDDGIRKVASLMGMGKIHFNRQRCPHTISEIPGYSWDPKKAKLGIESPLKQNDDCSDALRYGVATKVSDWRLTRA